MPDEAPGGAPVAAPVGAPVGAPVAAPSEGPSGVDDWADTAEAWSAHWARTAEPVGRRLADVAAVGPGTRVLDIGCGSGELLRHLADRGAEVCGIDPSAAMRRLARVRAPGADIREGDFERIGWQSASFDVVTAVNALQYAADPVEALRSAARVVRPGGCLAVASWAEDRLNDVAAIEAALTEADGGEADGGETDGGETPSEDELRGPGGLERVLRDAGLELIASGVVEDEWVLQDSATLVDAILLGEEPAAIAELGPVVVRAARAMLREDGAYALRTSYRWAVARTTE